MPDKEQAKPDAIDLLLSGYYLLLSGDILVAHQKARDAIEALIASERAEARLDERIRVRTELGIARNKFKMLRDLSPISFLIETNKERVTEIRTQLTPTEGDK